METYEVSRWNHGFYYARGAGDLTVAKFQHEVVDRIASWVRNDNPDHIGLCYDATDVSSFEPRLSQGGAKYPADIEVRILGTAIITESLVVRFATSAAAVMLRRQMKVFDGTDAANSWLEGQLARGARKQRSQLRGTLSR